MVGKIEIQIQLPPDFPGKYKEAAIKAAEQCTVKKHLLKPPVINVHLQQII
jgi:ribosomal protein S12 methylthiotransferase accessory factor